MKIELKALSRLIAIFALASAVSLNAQGAQSSSAAKLQIIQKTIDDYQKAGEKLGDPDVQKSILSDIAKQMPVDPKGKLDSRDQRKLTEEATILAGKKFHDSEATVAAKALREADKLFVMAEMKDRVSVRYKKGDNYYTAEGVFYGPGSSGNSIRVDDRIIALIDLLPEYRAKFDKEFNSERRRDYVNDKVQEYAAKRKQAAVEALAKLKEEQAKQNEANGFIFVWKDWRPVNDVVMTLISQAMSSDNVVVKKSAGDAPPSPSDSVKADSASKLDASAKLDSAKADAGAKQPGANVSPNVSVDSPGAGAASSYDELKARIDRRLDEIANTCAGPDSDQGYKNALWGLSREEISLLFMKEGAPLVQGTGSSDWIRPKEGGIKEVELQYISNILVKVDVQFAFTDQDGALDIRDALLTKYGLTDEQKAAMKEAEEERKADKAEKPADDAKDSKKEEKKDDKKDRKKDKGDKKQEATPLELSYHWTGKITTAIVYFKANATRSAYDEIRLSKFCPELMKKLNDDARRVKEESQKQKSAVKKKLDF